MKSERQLKASRANGALACGRKTPEGIARSARNALRHGLLARCVLLDGECPDAFGQLLDQFLARFDPVDDVEFGFIEEMASSFWRTRRAWSIETRLLNSAAESHHSGDDLSAIAAAFSSLAATPQLHLLNRYESRLHVMFQRALRNLLLLRKSAGPNDPNPISGHPQAGPGSPASPGSAAPSASQGSVDPSAGQGSAGPPAGRAGSEQDRSHELARSTVLVPVPDQVEGSEAPASHSTADRVPLEKQPLNLSNPSAVAYTGSSVSGLGRLVPSTARRNKCQNVRFNPTTGSAPRLTAFAPAWRPRTAAPSCRAAGRGAAPSSRSVPRGNRIAAFPKSVRILESKQFRKVYDGGRKFSCPLFAAFCLASGRSTPRVGFTLTKAMGCAVVRNRMRRRLREAVRPRLAGLNGGWEIVFNPRPKLLAAAFSEIEREVEKLFLRCNQY